MSSCATRRWIASAISRLAGKRVRARVVAYKPSHRGTVALVRELVNLAAKETRMLTIEEIMKVLPHRYPFLLVDRILELGPKRVVGQVRSHKSTPGRSRASSIWTSRLCLLGTLVHADDHFLELRNADFHDLRDTTTSRETVAACLATGIERNRKRVLLARPRHGCHFASAT